MTQHTMNDVCPLEVTQQELDDIQKCESVVVREYERDDGSRFSRPVAYGDHDEMVDQAGITGLFIVPVGLHIVCHKAIRVSDLLPADGFDPIEMGM